MRRFSFKGYYKNWYFRSFRELSYVLLCEKNGQKWRTAETDEFAVWYLDIYGKKKKHYADLFIDEHIIVEVKPRKYSKSKTVKLKAEAMKKFCEEKGYVYMMVAPRRIEKETLLQLLEKGDIIVDKSQEAILKRYLSIRKK